MGAATAVVAPSLLLPPTKVLAQPSAPLFVPAQNLDMGVPRHIFTATEMPKALPAAFIPEAVQRKIIDNVMGRSIPMLMLQDNFSTQYGGRIKAGAEVLTDRETADRWIRFNVATPGPSAPKDLQLRSAQRMMERKAMQRRAPAFDWQLDKREWRRDFVKPSSSLNTRKVTF